MYETYMKLLNTKCIYNLEKSINNVYNMREKNITKFVFIKFGWG